MILKQRNALKTGLFVFIAALWLLPATARANDYVLTFTDHPAGPMEIALPANVKFAIKLRNKPEFEKTGLGHAKPPGPRKEITAFNAPLERESDHPVRRN